MTATAFRTKTYPTDGVAKVSDVPVGSVQSVLNPVASVAAAGSTIADGTAISTVPASGVYKGTGADGTKGMMLPPSSGSGPIVIFNPDAASALKIYPATAAGAINNGAAGAALSVPANTGCVAYPMDGSENWRTVPRVPS